MVEFTLVAESSASDEEVIAGACDFSPRRIEIWPNVSARRYQVHASGETFTEATETAVQGLFWERSRYEWSSPGSVHQTVIDSNVLVPGCTWEITATPNGDGCHVEAQFRREFKRTPKGRFAYLMNRFAGTRVYGWDLRRALAAIESERVEREPEPPTAHDRPRPDCSDVRKLTPGEVRAAARALAQAFEDDPHMVWVFRDEAGRLRRLERAFATYLRRIWVRHDECYTHERLVGAAVWMPPGTAQLGPLAQLALLPPLARAARGDLRRLLKLLSYMEKRHPHEPEHWYLPAVGVVPAWQGRGFGSALLKPMLHRCDAERQPAYLEATSPANRALYERHGFEVVEECRVVDDGPPLWRMWREPGETGDR